MTMVPRYVTLGLDGETAYLRTDKRNQINKIDAAILDCDGVLIDIRDSYNRAISRSVAYIIEALTGCGISGNLTSDDVIFQFRKCGGFNNDWDTVYGILMYVLCNLPERAIRAIRKRIEETEWQTDPYLRLFSSKKTLETGRESEYLDDRLFETMMDGLKEFAEHLDVTGVESVDRNLRRKPGVSRYPNFYDTLKNFLNKGGAGEGIIATVFEELFCGAGLFLKTHGMKPRFYEGPGTVENGRAIISSDTLDQLSAAFGKANFGIASGSKIEPARHILKGILKRFRPESLVFLDDVEKAEREQSNNGSLKGSLRKPNPFSLFRAVKAFSSFKSVIYVGDSMEDVMMAKEAAKTDRRFLSGGAYHHSQPRDEIIQAFLDLECDLILPSVNELPLVLKRVGRDGN